MAGTAETRARRRDRATTTGVAVEPSAPALPRPSWWPWHAVGVAVVPPKPLICKGRHHRSDGDGDDDGDGVVPHGTDRALVGGAGVCTPSARCFACTPVYAR